MLKAAECVKRAFSELLSFDKLVPVRCGGQRCVFVLTSLCLQALLIDEVWNVAINDDPPAAAPEVFLSCITFYLVIELSSVDKGIIISPLILQSTL